MNSRESIYAALFNVAQSVPGFVTYSRRIRHIEDLAPGEFPAVFQTQVTEQFAHGNSGMGNLPPIGQLQVEWWVYVFSQDSTASHAA
ncbi:MAG: hypothetical protein JSR70_07550 [Proteobacteria bacterium]|nr:hypothetical protein [Pseudomonadota bacterium]